MPLPDVPKFTDLVTERLALCALDIMHLLEWNPDDNEVGMGRVFKLNPERAVNEVDLPVVYHYFGAPFRTPGAGRRFTDARNYYQRWLVAPIAAGTSTDDGSKEKLAEAIQYITPIQVYYEANNRLATYATARAGLQYCEGIMDLSGQSPKVQDSGIQGFVEENDDAYYGFELTIPVMMTMSINGSWLAP